jgi:hypothetical protein
MWRATTFFVTQSNFINITPLLSHPSWFPRPSETAPFDTLYSQPVSGVVSSHGAPPNYKDEMASAICIHSPQQIPSTTTTWSKIKDHNNLGESAASVVTLPSGDERISSKDWLHSSTAKLRALPPIKH